MDMVRETMNIGNIARGSLVRLQQSGDNVPTFALFEADGGSWKLETIENIARFLRAGIPAGLLHRLSKLRRVQQRVRYILPRRLSRPCLRWSSQAVVRRAIRSNGDRNQESIESDWDCNGLAEREGFEPSIQVLARITV
jgi:hypothetical protein